MHPIKLFLSLLFISHSIFAQFQPQTEDELHTAVDLWVDDNASALATYGDINTWDVSLITYMTGLFQYKNPFNSNISSWNVSNVIHMGWMFS